MIRSRIIAVQGEIIRPNTAPRLAMARSMAILCSQILGASSHANPTIAEIITAMATGNQKTSAMNTPQANKKEKTILKAFFNADTGITYRIMLSTITTEKI